MNQTILNNELFKKIDDQNYYISSYGNVYDCRMEQLEPIDNNYGYKYVSLSKNGFTRNFTIHNLVAKAFIDNPLNKRYVEHIDGDKSNNNITNLQYTTQSENCINKSMHSNNMSGHISVSWDGKAKKWNVRISENGKRKHLGYFDNIGLAVNPKKDTIPK